VTSLVGGYPHSVDLNTPDTAVLIEIMGVGFMFPPPIPSSSYVITIITIITIIIIIS
jgi:hypothetical protein